jgi:hypothetical protein
MEEHAGTCHSPCGQGLPSLRLKPGSSTADRVSNISDTLVLRRDMTIVELRDERHGPSPEAFATEMGSCEPPRSRWPKIADIRMSFDVLLRPLPAKQRPRAEAWKR